MNEIFLIRHGQSEANRLHLFGGDYPLSEAGKQQALDAKRLYGALPLDEIYCSRLRRTQETAELLFETDLPDAYRLAEMNELSFGSIENMPDTHTGVDGFLHSYQGDFVAFAHECRGDNPYQRAETAIRKMLELSRRMTGNPEAFPNRRIAIVTSATLMCSIMLTLIYGHRWRTLRSLPHPKNLECVKFEIDGAENRIIGFDFSGAHHTC